MQRCWMLIHRLPVEMNHEAAIFVSSPGQIGGLGDYCRIETSARIKSKLRGDRNPFTNTYMYFNVTQRPISLLHHTSSSSSQSSHSHSLGSPFHPLIWNLDDDHAQRPEIVARSADSLLRGTSSVRLPLPRKPDPSGVVISPLLS